MRYEARVYGTKEEIIDELGSINFHHSNIRRQKDAHVALEELDEGATNVRVGQILYVVEDPE